MCFLFATLYSDCQVFSGLAIKWLLASRMSYKAPANGEKGRSLLQDFRARNSTQAAFAGRNKRKPCDSRK